MSMNREISKHVLVRTIYLFWGTLLCSTSLALSANSQQRSQHEDSDLLLAGRSASVQSDVTDDKSAAKSSLVIPPGTILPIHLNSTISSAKTKPGQVITGRIMQDILLSPGLKIRGGAKVIGHIVEVTPATAGMRARIALQFDKLVSSHQTISITTNLRAIAGLMEVRDAETPFGAGESNDNQWLSTVQVGGDVAYGEGGPVTSGENANVVVGKLINGSLVGQVRAKEGTECRGAIDGNDRPQALWLFSSDACGVYGLEHISIAHAGRTDPVGLIVLTSNKGNIKIAAGAGLLLRVNAGSQN
jgi:hypothetical protein